MAMMLIRAMLDMEKEIEANNFLTAIYPARWVALKYMEKDEQILSQGQKENPDLAARLEETVEKVASHLLNTLDTYPEAMIADQRYGYIKSILKQGVIYQKYDQNRLYSSDRIDKVLTNRFLGPLIMLAVIAGLFHLVFTYSEVPVSWLESFFGWIGHGIYTILPDGLLRSLIVSGIIDGVGGVLGFVPLIMFMFFGIAFLEDSGYLARVAFMLDRVFRIFGLHGSSVMAVYRFRRYCRGLCRSGCHGNPDTEIPARTPGDPADRAVYELRGQAAGICPFDRCFFCKI